MRKNWSILDYIADSVLNYRTVWQGYSKVIMELSLAFYVTFGLMFGKVISLS